MKRQTLLQFSLVVVAVCSLVWLYRDSRLPGPEGGLGVAQVKRPEVGGQTARPSRQGARAWRSAGPDAIARARGPRPSRLQPLAFGLQPGLQPLASPAGVRGPAPDPDLSTRIEQARAARSLPAFRAAVRALAARDPAAAAEVLHEKLAAGPGPFFRPAYEELVALNATVALTAAAEVLNSRAPAAVRLAVASLLVDLADRHPELADPILSTLEYAAEADDRVRPGLDAARAEIVRRGCERERQAALSVR